MRALILAAGYGTRLYPLTVSKPKALLPVNGEPLLDNIIGKLKVPDVSSRLDEIVLVSNNRFYRDFLNWQDKQAVRVNIVNDGSNGPEERLGVMGDIEFALTDKTDDWLVIGSDNFFTWELGEFIEFSLSKRPNPVIGVYDIEDKVYAKDFGIAKLRGGEVEVFEEKPANPGGTLVSPCIYFFPGDSLGYIEEYLELPDHGDMAGQYISWLISKTRVFAFEFKGKWMDIGTKKYLDEIREMRGE